jgi:hypothetical protein
MMPGLRSDASETLTDRLLPRQIAHMIRTTTDDRLRRVCAILIGMSVLAVSVGTVTIMIHDGMH